jgi:hypothetical protein
VRRAADRDAVQVDRGGVDGAGQPDLLSGEGTGVRRRDPGRIRVVVAPAGIPAEARPVVCGGRDRLLRAPDTRGRPAAPAAGEDDPRDKDRD